jgi:hypothetical protein
MSKGKAFWEYVDKTEDCWLWMGTRDKDGYGKYHHNYHSFLAHRKAYELTFGEIPDGLYVMHKCNNPPCVNPDHLELGTNRENMLHCIQSGRHVWQVHPECAQKGEKRANAKLKEKQVLSIRDLYTQGGYSHRKLGEMFGVSHTVIQRIIAGKDWASAVREQEEEHGQSAS